MLNFRKIRLLRDQAGLSVTELADKVYVNYTMISKIEAGVKAPSVELLKRIADCLSVTVDELLLEAETS